MVRFIKAGVLLAILFRAVARVTEEIDLPVNGRKEVEHWRAEKRNWLYQNTISVAVLLVASFGGVFAFQTYQAAKRQADTARDTYSAQTRAWMTVSIDPDTFQQRWHGNGGVNFLVSLFGVNKGSSPALQVGFTVTPLLRNLGFSDIQGIVRKNCTVDKDTPRQIDYQSDKATGRFGVGLSLKQILAVDHLFFQNRIS